jgi:hypothetical protein
MEALPFLSIFVAYVRIDIVFIADLRLQVSLTLLPGFRYDRFFQIKMAERDCYA